MAKKQDDPVVQKIMETPEAIAVEMSEKIRERLQLTELALAWEEGYRLGVTHKIESEKDSNPYREVMYETFE